MYEAYLFLTDGFEEMEFISPLDILRRGGVELGTVSITGSNTVTGSHGVTVKADLKFEDVDFEPGQAILILVGGPGAENYKNHGALLSLLSAQHEKGGRLAAICAAPSVLGGLGILEGKTACCYPGYESMCKGAKISTKAVETDGNVTTSRSPSTAFVFGVELLVLLKGEEAAKKVLAAMPFN